MKKINYVLNENDTIKSWQAVPYDENLPHVEIDENQEIIIDVDKIIKSEFVEGDRVEYFERLAFEDNEYSGRMRRATYLDAYRKYQAAVNYGEFEREPVVDDFIEALRDKDWSAFENVPPQIKYFSGECNFEESGLKKEEVI